MQKTVLALTAHLATSGHALAMDSLSKFTWEDRVLLLFADEDDARLAEQVALLDTEKAGLAERDMVVLRIDGKNVVSLRGNADGIDAQSLRSEAGIEDDAFQAVLIGKDGGVKLRSRDVVATKDVFGLIDGMPMRRAGRD